jgi:hypothetical protein
MKRRRRGDEELSESRVKCVEYIVPFLPPCEKCGRCDDEPRLQRQYSWDWVPSSNDDRRATGKNEISSFSTLTTTTVCGNISKPVPIVDARSPDAAEKYRQAIELGEPIVLTGPKTRCLTEFALPWFKQGVFNVDEFCKSAGDAIGPIARNGYSGSQLEKGETMKVADYMRRYWPLTNKKEQCPYLAQWEFSAAVIDADDEDGDMNGEEEKGMRSFHWKLSTVPTDVVGTDFFSLSNINPYQYLFVGGPGTNSTVHNDLGGMTIFIVGMVGEKSVTLIHRDDEALMYGLEARKEGFMSSDDNQFYPLAHLARSWHHVVVPGDVLVMPPRTVSDNQTGLSKE